MDQLLKRSPIPSSTNQKQKRPFRKCYGFEHLISDSLNSPGILIACVAYLYRVVLRVLQSGEFLQTWKSESVHFLAPDPKFFSLVGVYPGGVLIFDPFSVTTLRDDRVGIESGVPVLLNHIVRNLARLILRYSFESIR